MGEFRGEELREQYGMVIASLVTMSDALNFAIDYEDSLNPENDKLLLLLDAEDRLRAILADDFGIRSDKV